MSVAKDVIRNSLGMASRVTEKYLEDLSADDLKAVVVDGMNPIAWQLGHLLVTEHNFVNLIKAGASPALPEGFTDAHRREAPGDPNGYLDAQGYLSLINAQRQATLAVLDALTDEELGNPNPFAPLQAMCPTVATLLNLVGCHYIMHSGQYVAVRRKLNKSIAI